MPSDKKLNLSTSFINHDYSQMKQSINVDKLLDNLENGFFIEAGAFDGEAFSNTLYFEIKRNWTGLLIEPIPSVFKDLLSKNRNVFSINACIGDKKPSLQLFNVLHVLSGRFDKMSVDHKKRILKEGLVNGKSVNSIALIPCFPIETILRALGQKKIDYFSLDVEGSELNIIKSLNYQEIDITAITLETSENIIDAAEITEHLSKNKFELMKRDYNEFYFLKINKKEF
jgi:FkbM family methyltransferase